MIIDFHTHIFPDKIAKKTIEYLASKGDDMIPFSDGSVAGLLSEMEEGGVDLAVTLPVMTNPAQFESVNRFAMEVNEAFANKERRLLSFAGIHPDCENLGEKMKWIRESGFLGIKIHPDYQDTFILDEKYLKILQYAKEYDLIVVTHAGVDAGYRGQPIHCPPDMVKEVIKKVPHSKFVLAHLGGNEMYDQVLSLLAGEDLYLDTAYVLRFVGKETFHALIKKHGEDRILFATDSPWSGMREDLAILDSFDLEENTKKKLLSDNAKKLLGIR